MIESRAEYGVMEAWVRIRAHQGDADSITKVLTYELARELDRAHRRIDQLEAQLIRTTNQRAFPFLSEYEG